MMYWGASMGPWGYVLMTAAMVAFWALVIGGIVVLVGRVGNVPRNDCPRADSIDPARVLAERYARGDIDEADYRQRLKVLSGK